MKLGLATVALSALLSCSCQNGQLPPVVAPSVNLAVCIFQNYVAAPSCRPTGNWPQCVSTIANSCGADAASVAQVLTAHHQAELADRQTPAADAGHE